MKTLTAIVKVLAALAAVAGAVYVVATYGDQIVAWAKKLLSSLPKKKRKERKHVNNYLLHNIISPFDRLDVIF